MLTISSCAGGQGRARVADWTPTRHDRVRIAGSAAAHILRHAGGGLAKVACTWADREDIDPAPVDAPLCPVCARLTLRMMQKAAAHVVAAAASAYRGARLGWSDIVPRFLQGQGMDGLAADAGLSRGQVEEVIRDAVRSRG